MSSSSSTPASNTAHAHKDGKCPFHDAQGSIPHAWCPPQPGDSRAPCPALNSMANHGYLPRDGKRLTPEILVKALKECFALSNTLAWFLTHGALFLLGQSDRGGQQLCLHDLARHGGVEHDASLYHPDAEGNEYAPLHGDPQMLQQFFDDSKDGLVMTALDIARVRARRQASYPKGHSLDFIHAELARGEVGIVLNCFNNPNPILHAQGVPLKDTSFFIIPRPLKRLLGIKPNPETTPIDGVPIEVLRYWFENERLPEGWKPYHKTTLRQTIGTVNVLRSGIRKFAKDYTRKEVPAIAPAPAPVLEEKVEARVLAPEPTEILAGETSLASPTLSESDSEGRDVTAHRDDVEQTLLVPPLIKESSVSSATSSTFTDVLQTPKISEFIPQPVGKDVVVQDHGLGEVGADRLGAGGNEKLQISGLPQIVEQAHGVLAA